MRIRRCSAFAIVVSGIVAMGSCNQPQNRETAPEQSVDSGRTARDQSARADQSQNTNQTINVTGCVQKQDQLVDRFILTQTGSPQRKPETAGGTATVESEHLRAAMYAYELKGMNDELDKLVGKEVRVTGTLDEASSLGDSAAARNTGPVGTRGNEPAERELRRGSADRDIDTGALASLKVQHIEQIANQCQTAAR